MGRIGKWMSGIAKRAGITFANQWVDNPDRAFWFGPTLGDGNTMSGVTVTSREALGYGPFWRGVNIVSSVVGKTPIFVYKRDREGGMDRDKLHPAYRLLRRKPNSEMTANIFKETLTGHMMIGGNGYAFILRDGSGNPIELRPLEPCMTWPVREGGRLFYQTMVDGRTKDIPAENMIHIRGIGYDGVMGYNVVEMARETIGAGIAMRDYGSAFFKNGATMSAWLEYPQKLTPNLTAAIQEEWEKKYTGTRNSHRPAILSGGAKAHEFGNKADESQLIEQRQQGVRETANFVGCPPHMLGDPTRTSYNSIEQEDLAFLQYTADAVLSKWEEELYDKLLSPTQKQRDSHTIEFLRESLIRADTRTATDATIAEVNNGLLTLDEARAMRGRGAADNGIGKKFRRPANIVIEGEEPEPVAPPGDDAPDDSAPTPTGPGAGNGDDDRSFSDMLGVHVRRAVDRVANKARRAAKHPDTFIAFVDDLSDGEPGLFIDNAAAVFLAMRRAGYRGSNMVTAANGLFSRLCEELRTAAEVQASELPASVDRTIIGWDSATAGLVDDMVASWRSSNGTAV